MKKIVAILVAALLTTGVILAAAGCGGERSQAREYIIQGDSSLPTESELSDFIEKEAALREDIVAGRITTQDEFDSRMSEIEDSIDSYREKNEKARSEFEKVLTLQGVDEYQVVARKYMEKLEIYDLLLTEDLKLLNSMADIAIAKGGPLEDEDLAALEEDAQELESIGQQLETLDEEIRQSLQELGFTFSE